MNVAAFLMSFKTVKHKDIGKHLSISKQLSVKLWIGN